jgi:3-methyladenine DNA glycosylase AlkD
MVFALLGPLILFGTAAQDRWGSRRRHAAALENHAREHAEAWARVEAWSGRSEEYVRRAAFALLWGLTRHDREAPDSRFLHGLELIEAAAGDERPYVQKAVNMALRATGKRNPALRRAALAVALRLAAADDPAARWVGKDALRELQPTVRKPTPKRTDR